MERTTHEHNLRGIFCLKGHSVAEEDTLRTHIVSTEALPTRSIKSNTTAAHSAWKATLQIRIDYVLYIKAPVMRVAQLNWYRF